MTPTSRTKLAALAQPGFWIALALLLLNDHVLKGARVLPGVVTGKLSDLAGLIVAPVLLASLVGAESRARRAAAFAAVALPFAAIKISPDAARLVEHVVALTGMSWRIWTDPTDLVALASLPLAWRMLDAARASRGAWALERIGVMVGAAACIATSAPPADPSWTTWTYVHNGTGVAQDVRIRWVDSSLDCNGVALDPRLALARESFGTAGATFHLDPTATVPLDRGPAYAAAGLTVPPTGTLACDAALVQIEGMPDMLVFWETGGTRRVAFRFAAMDAAEGGEVRIVDDRAGLHLAAGTGMTSAPLLSWLPPAPACDGGTPEQLGFSSPSFGSIAQRIDAITTAPDGCLAVALSSASTPGADPSTFHLCAAPELFPWAVGETISAQTVAGGLTLSDATRALTITLGSSDIGLTSSLRASLRATSCAGARDACGAFYESYSLALVDGTLVLAGEVAPLPPDSSGRPGLLQLGRAERVTVAHLGCEAGRDQLGYVVDIAILRTEVMP